MSPMRSSNRILVAAFVVLIGGGAFRTPAAAATGDIPPAGKDLQHVAFQVHWYPQAQFAGYMVAVEQGLFRQAGLDVQLLWAAAGERPFEQLAEGRTDFCTGWLSDAMQSRSAGKPLVNISQVFQRSSSLLVARSDSGIDKPEDMAGRRVGLWGGNTDVQAIAFFHKYQVEPILIPQSNSIVPFLRGAVDVASAMHYNEYHKLMEAGVSPDKLRVFALADYGLAFPEDGLYCTDATRRDRAALCSAFVDACNKGWSYAFDHETQTLDTVMKYCRDANVRTNRNHQRWMLRSVAVAIRGSQSADAPPSPWGSLAPDAYDGVARILIQQKLLQTAPAFDAFYRPPSQ
jgi:NitT/TauT family transport system substrate-binding protein